MNNNLQNSSLFYACRNITRDNSISIESSKQELIDNSIDYGATKLYMTDVQLLIKENIESSNDVITFEKGVYFATISIDNGKGCENMLYPLGLDSRGNRYGLGEFNAAHNMISYLIDADFHICASSYSNKKNKNKWSYGISNHKQINKIDLNNPNLSSSEKWEKLIKTNFNEHKNNCSSGNDFDFIQTIIIDAPDVIKDTFTKIKEGETTGFVNIFLKKMDKNIAYRICDYRAKMKHAFKYVYPRIYSKILQEKNLIIEYIVSNKKKFILSPSNIKPIITLGYTHLRAEILYNLYNKDVSYIKLTDTKTKKCMIYKGAETQIRFIKDGRCSDEIWDNHKMKANVYCFKFDIQEGIAGKIKKKDISNGMYLDFNKKFIKVTEYPGVMKYITSCGNLFICITPPENMERYEIKKYFNISKDKSSLNLKDYNKLSKVWKYIDYIVKAYHHNTDNKMGWNKKNSEYSCERVVNYRKNNILMMEYPVNIHCVDVVKIIMKENFNKTKRGLNHFIINDEDEDAVNIENIDEGDVVATASKKKTKPVKSSYSVEAHGRNTCNNSCIENIKCKIIRKMDGRGRNNQLFDKAEVISKENINTLNEEIMKYAPPSFIKTFTGMWIENMEAFESEKYTSHKVLMRIEGLLRDEYEKLSDIPPDRNSVLGGSKWLELEELFHL